MLHRVLAVGVLVGLAAWPAGGMGARAAAAPAGAVAGSVPALFVLGQETKASEDPVERIKDEGTNRSQVMKTLGYLTDVIGPRLTGSPGLRRANEWTRDTLAGWGLQNAKLEAWGPFGRGWTLKRFSAQVVEPQCIPLIGYPKAWSPGLEGPLTAPVFYLDAKDESELQKYRGQLKGAIVLVSPPREVKPHFEPRATRRSDKSLLDLADAAPSTGRGGRRPQLSPRARSQAAFQAAKLRFLTEEGAALLLEPSRAGDDPTRPSDGGTVFVTGASVPTPASADPEAPGARRVSAWDRNAPKFPPQVVLAAEHYNRMVRMVQQGERLKVAVDLQAEYQDDDPMAYNTVAEIPGSDRKDEVVMLGGHLDSWHSGTGATDNAAGIAVVMEACRILQALKLQQRRTIRVALWTGEEQGLLGSQAYVAAHFGKLETMGQGESATRKLVTKPEYEKLSGYFNLDNGTGKIRGVYMQGNEAVRPLFRQWLQPFRAVGAQTLSLANTGGTDHLSFDGIGLPGFQFIQDELEYSTRTHHSNQDLFDRIQADDMKQAAVIMAAFVYQTAMLDEKLPRKSPPAGR